MKKFFYRRKDDASASTEPLKEKYGLFDLDNTIPDADVDIVAVHGLGGHYEDTWIDKTSQKLWLRDFLPSQLQDADITARVMSYGYDSTTAFSQSVTNIDTQAEMLLDDLKGKRTLPAEEKRPLIFVAHSLGGIIVKKALILAHERSSRYRPLSDSVQALVFFGVPHRGSDLANWTSFAARALYTTQLGLGTNTAYVEDLKKNSKTLGDISKQGIERAAPPVEIRTFFETEKLNRFLIVNEDSARLNLINETARGIPAADHITVCKFNDKDSQKYRPVWKAFVELCKTIKGNTAPPGKQPGPLFMIPSPKDPHFTGREGILDLVKTKFKTERRVALTGIGGVGKSQIAIEYCHRFRQDHPAWNILWVYASNIGRFEQSFQEIARKLRLPGWDDPAKNTLEIVSDWLHSGEAWLMVIDNADNQDVFFPQQLETTHQTPSARNFGTPLAQYLPQTSITGSILITSRTRDAAFCLTNSDESIVHVPFMDKEDAIALFCRKMKKMCNPDDRSSDTEKVELVERLDCLPLAITQATSYIIVRKDTMTIPKYSKYLERNADILLARVPDNRRDAAYPNSVLLTWQTSFNRISQDNEPAAELLSLMSVLDRQGIPRTLLRGKYDDDLDFQKRLDPLIAFSLITLDEDDQSFQMHRLVQIAVQSWLERDGHIDRFKQQALNVIAINLPGTRWDFWETWEILLPHAQIALGYAYPDREIQLLHAKILRGTARYLEVRGKYDLAIERCKRALDIRLDLLGEEDDKSVGSLVQLSRIERARAREQGQTTRSNGPPTSDSHEATLRRMMGKVYGRAALRVREELARTLLYTRDDEKVDEAIEHLESIVDLRRDTQGIKYQGTLGSMSTLADAYQTRGRLAEAATIMQEVLDTTLTIYRENDPRISISMLQLASIMRDLNKNQEAYDFGKRSLDMRIRAFGKEDSRTLDTMRLLASILIRWSSHDETKYQEAYEVCRQAMDLHTSVLGEENENTMYCIRKLVIVLEAHNRYGEAEDLRRHRIALRTAVHGPEDSRTIK